MMPICHASTKAGRSGPPHFHLTFSRSFKAETKKREALLMKPEAEGSANHLPVPKEEEKKEESRSNRDELGEVVLVPS